MDTTQNDSITENSNPEVQQGDLEQQQILLEGTDKSTRPTLSEFKKSWGFRRTTIARREFMEEMTDIDTSPSPVRRSRGRRAKQTPQTAPDTQTTQRTTRSSKSVIDDLEWSAPSSPVLMDTETTPETSTGGTLDPSLWQDFGSAFHTAFSLLGAKECASTDMPDALAASDSLEANDDTEAPANEDKTDGMEAPDHLEAPAEVDIAEPIDIPITDIDIEESDNILVISSRDEDTEELTVMEIKETQASKRRQTDTRSRGVKGGRGKAKRKGRGRGRARGRGRRKGRGRGRATEPESSTADDEEDDDEVVFVSQTAQPQLPETEKESSPERGAAMEMSRSQSPLPITKCIILDNDLEQTAEGAPGQYDDAPQEKEEDKNTAYSSISDSKGYDPDALYCICRQKHNKRFMISCDSCQEWFHGDCVGVTEVQGRKMEKMGQEYICPCCVTKKHNQLQPNPQPQPEPDPRTSDTIQERLTPSPPGKEEEETEKQQASKEAVVEEKEAESKMQTDGSLPLCIGPGCPKHALPDSVYCGTDCILQHAALTMKSLSTPKEPKSRGRQQRKTATSKLTTKVQRSVKVSERSADQPEEEGEEQRKGYGREEEATSPSACDPCLTAAQAPSKPSSNLSTALDKDSEEVKDKPEPVAPLNQSPEEPSTETSPSSEPVTELSPLVGSTQNKAKKSSKSDGALKKQSVDSAQEPSPPAAAAAAAETPSTSPSSKHHETGALMVTKTSFVIPKKQLGPPPNTASACPSGSQPSSTPTLLNEPRNLPVSPAPIAPSSRPSQPNNQVRQSIQRSLTSILYKRVCDCDDLDVSESDVGKLVTSIEMEMFDIFRNTDSKYMNKYRTIMFNLKDPRNKGLLYRVMRGEISPFRLARMSQKDMQATKVPEPSPKQTAEAKDTAAKAPCLLQKPEAVKVDLPSLSLNPTRSDRNTEQKRNLLPVLKTRPHQPSQSSSMPDILSCVLKDTTSEHKAHLFDLKCKICTGQIPAAEEEEPVQKKAKVSESRDKRDYGQSCYTNTSECSWRGSAGDESPLRAPPDSPAMDSSTSSLMESSSCLIIDAPALTIVESPASPVQDSPASPILESPASPVMESPASPTSDSLTAKTQIRSYTPVMIPAVSTVTITRRDPRTAANRSSALSTDTSGPSNTSQNQPANYIPVQETSSSLPLPQPTSLPPPSVLPKSILMKPSSVDPRLYGASSRTINSHSPTDGETVQFLAKQDILWKGFLNMMSVAKFVTKAYLVSGSPENLKADLPDTIQIGGRIMPQTVWDYVARLKTSVTKELCVIRFHPATEEEEVAYVSLFSYFSSRGRFGVVANNNRSIKDVYLVPLSAKEAIPSKLLPLDGPGLEKNRPNLLLGLAITQKPKRPGNFQQEVEEKRPKVHMSKDPMWIPKPPVLYGSDKLEIFQPYDPETPISATCPSSPPSTGSPSDSSSSGSINAPSLLASTKATPPISTSVTVPSTPSTSKVPFDKNPPTTSGDSTPLQTILKTLFGNKPSDSEVTAASSSTINTVGAGKLQGPSQAPHPMVDPIVQQYGQKSKVKEIEEEENEYDRPYDPEEEYNPAMGYGMVASLSEEKIQTDNPAPSTFEEDDVAYDPEDDTIFEDIHTKSGTAETPATAQISAPTPCPVSTPVQVLTPIPTLAPAQAPSPAQVLQSLPSGTVVVSAATLTEQQRMLEELNKQIEEQKRQLKEQEEALRQQREAVGMFMAHFSVSDSLMSPPAKSLPLLTSQQTDVEQSRSKPSESADNKNDLTQATSSQNVDSKTVKTVFNNLHKDSSTNPEIKNDISNTKKLDKTLENVKETEMYFSAGEIEDSDVAYDPEDESLFNEMQDDVFQGGSAKTLDSSLSSASHTNTPSTSHQGRRHRQSPKTRSRRDRDRRGSSPKRSQQRSPSHSRRRKEKDRHRRSERDRSKHRARDQGHHHRERSSRRHSRGRRRSPSPPRKREFVSFLPRQQKRPSPHLMEESKRSSVPSNKPATSAVESLVANNTSSHALTKKNDSDGPQLESIDSKFPDPHKNNLDKDSSTPLTCNLVPAVKLGMNEQEQSLEPQKHSAGDHQDTGGGPLQLEVRPSEEEPILNSKIESTVPLREIDPPIRDSPQSPDPEPQFVKPSSIGKSDLHNVEEDKDPAPNISSSVPNASSESNCPSDDSLKARVNIELPGTDDPNPRMKCLDLKSHVFRGQGINETDKLMERKSPGPRHLEIIDQAVQNSSPCPGSANTSSGLDSGIQGPDMRLLGIKSLGLDINVLGIQIYGANKSDLEQNLSGQGMGVPSPYVCGPGIMGPRPDVTGIRGLMPAVTGIRGPRPDLTGIRGPISALTGMRCPRPDMTGLGINFPRLHMTSQIIRGPGEAIGGPGLDITGFGIRCPRPDIRGPGMRGLELEVGGPVRQLINLEGGGPGTAIRYKEQEMRGQRQSLAIMNTHIVRSNLQSERNDPGINNTEVQGATRDSSIAMQNPLLDITGSDIRGPGKDMRHQSPGTGGQGPNMGKSDLTVSNRDVDINYLQLQGSGADVRGPGTEMPYQGQVIMDESKGSSFKGPQTDGGVINPLRAEMACRSDVVDERKFGLSDPATEIKDLGSDTISQGRGRGRGQSRDMRAHNPERGFGPHMTHQSPCIRGERHVIEGPGLPNRGRSSDGRTQSPDFKCSDPDRKRQCISSLGQDRREEGPGGPRQRLSLSALDLRGHSPDRGSDRGALGPEVRGPESGLMGPGLAMRGKDLRGQNPDFRSPGSELTATGYDTRCRGRGVRETSPDARGQARRGPGQDWREKRHGRDPGSDERSPRHGRRGLGSNIGDVDSGSGEAFQDRGPGFNKWIEGRANRPSSGVISEKQGPQRGPSPGMRASGPDRRDERGGPSIGSAGHDIRGAGLDLRVPGSDNATEMTMQGPNVRGPEIRHEVTELSMRGTQNRGSSQDLEYGSNLDSRDERRVSNPRWQNTGDQIGQAVRGPIPDTRNPDWQGLGPNAGGPDRENIWKGPDYMGPGMSERDQNIVQPGPNMRDPNWSGPHSELRDERRGPERRGSSPAMREPAIPDDWRVHGTDKRSLNMEVLGSDRRGPGGPDFRGPGPDRRVLGMKGPGPDRRGPGGPDMEGSVPDRKGPRGPDFRGPVPERQGQHTECQGPNRTGGPDFTGPGPDRRGPGGPDLMGPSPAERGSGGPDFMGLRPNRRGPGGPDFIGPGPERRGPGCPDFMGPGPDRRGPGVLDYTGPGLERQGQHTEGPGLHRKGGPDFMRPQPDTRGPKGPDFMGPGPDRRGPGGLDFMGPGTDRRGPGVPDYTGPGPERQCQLTEGPGPHRTGGPNFMGPWPDRRGPGGPDIRGPGPGRRGPDTEGPGPTGRDPLGPNPMGSDPDRGESDMECPGPNRQGPDFVGPGPGRRGSGGPDFMGPGPNRRRPGDPDLRGPRPDRGGHGVPNFSGLGPERSGPGGPDFRATGPDRRELEGPDCRGPGPERVIPDIEGPRPYRRGSRGPDFKDPGIKRGTNLEGPVNNRRGPQEEWGIEEFDGLGPIWDQGQRPHSAGPGNEWRGPDFRTIGLERRGPEFRGSGLNIREGRKMRGPGPEISSPNTGDEWAEQGFRGPEPDRRGPVMEGQWSDRGRANMEGPESERQGPGDEYRRPGFMGPGPIFRGPDMEGPGHCRRGPGDEWRGPDRGCPEPDRWGPGPNFRRERHPNMGEPGLDRTGLDMRGPGPGEGQRQLDCRGPGPNRRVQNMEAQRSDEKDHRMGGDWKGFDRECQDPDRLGPDFRHNTRGPNIEGPRPDSRGSDFRNPQSNRRSSDMEAPSLERKCFGGSDYRGPGSDRRGPGVRNEWSGPDSRAPGPDRRGPDFRGLGSERSGPEIECPGPGRRGLEPDFREEGRDPEVRGPRPEQDDWRGLDLRGLGPEWRHLSRDGPRPERRGPYMEAARSDSKGQDMMGPKMDTRGHEPDFIKDMQESDFRGPGSVTRGKEPRLRGRMIGNERKGPDNREPDSKHSDVLTSPHFNNPRMPSHNQSSSDFQTGQQATRFQGPGGPHSSPFSRPMGPTSDMGGQPRLHFDSPNIPPTVRPLKHKAPLLPTPTEGLIRLPNRIINSHDVPNKKQQKSNSPDSHGREWNRVTSRPASRERDLDKEVGRQEQGQTSGGHGSTPVGVSAGLVEVNKKEDNEVDKHKGHSPCEISKTSQTTINIGQPEREPKEKQAKKDNSDIPQD